MGWTEAKPEDVDTVLDWLREKGGEALAHEWLMSCTPYPCALPSPQQLNEGFMIATGELLIGDIMDRIVREMDEAMESLP